MKLLFALAAASLAFSGSANAAIQLSGSFGTYNGGGGAYSSNTLTLLANNYVSGSIQGAFVGILPQNSLITTYSSTITGIGSSPTSIAINNFFQIASPSTPTSNPYGLSGAGTTPANRFEFNLKSIQENYVATGNGVGTAFHGWGTLVDTTGAYADSPASFTLSFSSSIFQPGSYSFTFAAVPEPGAYGACAAALALLPFVNGAVRNLRKRPSA